MIFPLQEAPPDETAGVKIARQANALAGHLQALRAQMFPPRAARVLRSFSSLEAAKLIGVSDGYLRQLSLDGLGPKPEILANNRRAYSLDQVNELRAYLAEVRPREALNFLPRRRVGERLQVLAVCNFKGGSAKTTTSAYLTQYLALHGYRVLAIDLDPQASLSAMYGFQPELDVSENETLYGAIRYDDMRRPMAEVIKPTYFPGIDLIPGNLELAEFEHDTPQAIADGRARGDGMFFRRVSMVIEEVEADYDVVVIDCPPQLGYLTLGAIHAATGLIVTVHPQMLDVASMAQFLLMTSDLVSVIEDAGGQLDYDFIRYVITRHEPHSVPEAQVVTMLRSLFGEDVLGATVYKSAAITDAGLSKQTLYEIDRGSVGRATYDRAIESVDAANAEIAGLMWKAWGRT